MVVNFFNLLILSLSALTLSTFFFFTRRRHSADKTPTPQSYPLVGNIIGFLRNRHRFHDWVTDMLSTTPSLTLQVNGFLGLSHGICTADPTNLQHILRFNFLNYIKGSRYTSVLQELLGRGIFNSDGNLWSSQRKIASHEFNTKSLRTFISETVQSQIVKSLIPYLLSVGDHTLDLQQVLRKFSFDNICNVAFGVDTCLLTTDNKDSKDSSYLLFVQAFDVALEHTSNRFMSPLPAVWKVKRFLNIGSERKFKEAIEIVNRFAMDVIKLKETQVGCRNDEDLLSRFMASSLDMGFDDDDERRKFLRDIVISFILAGKDSTSTALTWFFWLLDGHPHCKHLIHKEFSKLMTSSHHVHPLNLTFDDLKNLNYLHAALSESMRLFPPVPINSRLTVEDDILPDGTYVGKGWFADYSAYAMGRMEKLWGSDCREFKPERWLDGDGVCQPLDQYKYPVFHGGFRMCLGNVGIEPDQRNS